ncbi:MAG: hypothetical protein AB1714_27015 [Acidobacteriota bacterium]
MIERIRVGGITLAIRYRRESRAIELADRLLPFMPGHGADIRLELVEAAAPAVSPAALVFDSGSLWRVYQHGEDLVYAFRSPDAGDQRARVLVIDRARTRGTLHVAPSRYSRLRGFAMSYPLDEVLFQHAAAARGFMVVHACGVAVESKVFLFCGESGAGKTTTARLWRRYHRAATVLSDDRMLVRPYRGRLWAFGTPWHGAGKFASPLGGRLAAILFLARGDFSRVEPMPEAAAAAQLFTRAFPPMWEPAVVDTVLATCSRAAREIPCGTLYFRPDATSVRAVEGMLLR